MGKCIRCLSMGECYGCLSMGECHAIYQWGSVMLLSIGECHAVHQEGSVILMTLPSGKTLMTLPLGETPMKLPSGDELPCSGLIQWARGLKPSAAARPGTRSIFFILHAKQMIEYLWSLQRRVFSTSTTYLHFACINELGIHVWCWCSVYHLRPPAHMGLSPPTPHRRAAATD